MKGIVPGGVRFPKGDSLQRAVEVLRSRGPMLAGALGYEMWGAKRTCRTENTTATQYCRAAGKILKRAKKMGLVYDRQVGPQRLWWAWPKEV